MTHEKIHGAEHTDGTDDIQDATAGQKGLATSTQISKLDGIDDNAVDAAGAAAQVTKANLQANGDVGTGSGQVSQGDHLHAIYQPVSEKDANNGYAGLDAGGLLNPAQLPPLAITDTFVVASEVAQLALTVQKGDVAIRTDEVKSYINVTGNNVSMADWQYIISPTDAILSVFSRVGVITAQNGDYTGSQVTNVPAGDIAAVTVQAAIDELDSEKEPAFSKNSAFNKLFGFVAGAIPAINGTWTGSKIIETDPIGKKLQEVSKRTAYNKDLGTGSGEVCEGDDSRLQQATETARGTAEIATQAETDAGTDDLRMVTAKKLKAAPHKIIQDLEEGVDSTNAATPQLAFTTAKTLETAKYLVQMQMELLSSGGGPTGRCQGQFEIDDGVTPVEIANVAQSVAGYCVRTSFYILDATAGDYDFNWYFNKASSGGSNVSVRRKRLTILKVVE